MPEYHVVSCEPCKRKKCKCDRVLPCCSQCSSSPSFCKYFNNNKRGIPGGYLNTLEQRLDETEKALYNALAELRALQSNDYIDHQHKSISGRPANATKASRMEEWKSLPLKDPQDIQRWWESVGGESRGTNEGSRHRSYDARDEDRYSEQDTTSTLQDETGLGGNIPDGLMVDSPRSLVSHLSQTDTSRINENTSNMELDPGPPQGDGDPSFWPIGAPTTTVQHPVAANESTPELSKSKQLSQAMKHMYY